MNSSPEQVGSIIRAIFEHFNWKQAAWIYHQHDKFSGLGISDCQFTILAIRDKYIQTDDTKTDKAKEKKGEFSIDEKTVTTDYLKSKVLSEIKKQARSELLFCVVKMLTIISYITEKCKNENKTTKANSFTT